MKSLKEILRSLEGLSDIELFVIDLFCGAGGLSEGVEEARLDGNRCGKVVCCVNHDKNAILSHDANIPDALHFIEDIRTLELSPISTIVERIRQLYPDAMIMLHASLECTNFSKAKGGQPRDADSRTLAEHLFRYIDVIDPDYIQIENVEDLKNFLHELNVEPLYQAAITQNDLQLMAKFASTLLELSTRYNISYLQHYSQTLLDKIDTFDIAQIETLLHDYPKIMKTLAQKIH